MTSADAASVFQRLEDSGLIARGAVNIIGLDTVRDRLGERWDRKRPVVWEHVQASAERNLSPADLCLRLDETDFAIAVSNAEPAVGQALCLRVLRDVLEHFLGECRTDDLVIRSVTGLVDGKIQCAPLDPHTIRLTIPADAPAPAAPTAPPARSRSREQPFIMTSMGGRELKLKHEMETLMSLSARKAAATVLEPSVLDVATGRRIPAYAFTRLTDPDLWAIDQLTIGAAAEAAEAGGLQTPLMLPLSYQSVSSSRGRSRLVELLSTRAGAGLAVAITNVTPGTPRGCLAEAIAMLRRMEVSVLVRVAPVRDALAAVDLAKPNGAVLDVEPLNGAAERIRQAIAAFPKQASGVGSILVLRGTTNPAALSQAAAAGFTHWSAADPDSDMTLAA